MNDGEEFDESEYFFVEENLDFFEYVYQENVLLCFSLVLFNDDEIFQIIY